MPSCPCEMPGGIVLVGEALLWLLHYKRALKGHNTVDTVLACVNTNVTV